MKDSRVAIVGMLVMGLLGGSVFAVVIDTVPVGNPSNEPDTRHEASGYGSVGYLYNIGKYEVTSGQYTEFLNAVAGVDSYALYNTTMSRTDYGSGITRSGGGTVVNPYTYSVATAFVNRPVNYVSYWDSCRFANWLHNGQGNGDTETGAYTLNGYNGDDGRMIQRNANWKWALTSEDEWYKAAYHKNDGVTGNYWDYPTSSNTQPGRDMADASSNNANFYTDSDPYPIDSPYYTTAAGEFQNSDSPYGTFDQGGNILEWNESLVYEGYAYRDLRGGSFADCGIVLNASYRGYEYNWAEVLPSHEDYDMGFRVAAVPEPASLCLLALGGLAVMRRKRR